MGCAVFYPAGLPYVFGVEGSGSGGGLAFFSNYDQDGPVFSQYEELFNYELRAPGLSVVSSIPNGNYRVYSGTSMATPMVCAGISLYKKIIPDEVHEFMWIKLINTRGSFLGDVKFMDAFTISPPPLVYQLSKTIIDSCATCDNDGRVDAGETIEIWFKVRNVGGPCDSVYYSIKFGEFEDTTTAQILKSTAFVGSMGPYAVRNSTDQFIIKISPDVAHDRDIVFEGLMWYMGATDTTKQRIILTIENGTQLSGIMDSTLILTPDRLWLVNESFRIGYNGHLILKPGTQVLIYPGKPIMVKGDITAIGKPDSLIIISSYGGYGDGILWQEGNSGRPNTFKYCSFENFSQPVSGYNFDVSYCKFINVNYMYLMRNFTNNIFYYSGSWGGNSIFYSPSGAFKFNNFINRTETRNVFFSLNSAPEIKFNNFIKFNAGELSGDSIGVSGQYNSFINPNSITIYANGSGGPDYKYFRNQYFGTVNTEKIDNMVYDFGDQPSLPYVVYYPYLNSPSDSAHGIVWKVLVNGKDAQDEYVEPLGVGPQRFDVYFNRSMDTTYIPILGFGVREPFNSNLVQDSVRWSSDGKIWTAYHTMKIYTGDGINRIRVSGARDPEGFEIPVEDMRFEFLIDAAGSASTDFTATAGLGKVNLEWTNPDDVIDLLGYNMYRFEHLTDTTFTMPIQANSSLVTDTLFTDFDVIPNKKYYYYYKVVRTDFSESDSSRITNAIPFTAAIGDANGDLGVSVLDILSEVSYILGQNPQPFIFDAADVARDSIINVLDVVGTVNIILGGGSMGKYFASESYGNAKLELVNNKLMLTTDVPLSGIQVKLKGSQIRNLQFINHNISCFENVQGNIGDTLKIIMYYSLNNNELTAGSYELGRIEGMTGSVYLTEAVLADKNGNNVLTNVVDNGVPLIPTEYYLDQNFPNPFNSQTIIQYGVPEKATGRITIYNILGQRVKTFELGEMAPGRYRIQWDGRNNYGVSIASGVYIYRFESKKFMSAKKLLLLK